ncbi:hypothetical protein B0A68_20290 [Flavobacterium reichenbachii]|uniref:Uncharacterized protein n=1 Tax=Flavobacterium reichenbachii TaxID=362418 RepID=A0A085ZDG7_9FLAO|nr:hypothetical protein IW19_24645 [Flavobacterium reichenbachii]OXB11899.1 hypothetical protein B0A68_20290 [Flavobacterium reichenbachii]
MVDSLVFWACPSGSGYPLQVLALPSSGCGLYTSIPHANGFTRTFWFPFFNTQSCHSEERDPSDSEQAKQISASSSPTIGDYYYGVICGDSSFLGMTKNTQKI